MLIMTFWAVTKFGSKIKIVAAKIKITDTGALESKNTGEKVLQHSSCLTGNIFLSSVCKSKDIHLFLFILIRCGSYKHFESHYKIKSRTGRERQFWWLGTWILLTLWSALTWSRQCHWQPECFWKDLETTWSTNGLCIWSVTLLNNI